MIRDIFKKSEYTPIQKIDNNKYRIMWGKVDMFDDVYQKDESGNLVFDENERPIVTGKIETEYCTCCHETVRLPKNTQNIVELIESGRKKGYPEPSMEEWCAWGEIFATETQFLPFLKERLKSKITEYDKSNAVNEFTINDVPVWLDKETRVGLKLRFEAEMAQGKTETVLWYGNIRFSLDLANAVQMLYALEVYASLCYDNTQLNYLNVDNANDKDAVMSYCFTSGYPEKLKF